MRIKLYLKTLHISIKLKVSMKDSVISCRVSKPTKRGLSSSVQTEEVLEITTCAANLIDQRLG